MQKPEMTLCSEWTREELQNSKGQTIFHKHCYNTLKKCWKINTHLHSSKHALGKWKINIIWQFDSFFYIAFLHFVVMNSDLMLTPFASHSRKSVIWKKKQPVNIPIHLNALALGTLKMHGLKSTIFGHKFLWLIWSCR